EACKFYADALTEVEKAAGSMETHQWERADAAVRVKLAAEKHQQPYLDAAVKLCGASRQVITMDVKAEELRRRLGKFNIAELPKGSFCAFYELHRGAEAANLVAGTNPTSLADAKKKVLVVAKKIAKAEATVRDVRAAFKGEFQKVREAKRGARAV